MSRYRLALVLAVLLTGVWYLGTSHDAPPVRADNVTPSPGPISTVMPMPCPTDFQPTAIGLDWAGIHKTVATKSRLDTLYRALCALPPVSPQQINCSFGRTAYVVNAFIHNHGQIVLLISLGLGQCRVAGIAYHGYSAAFRVPDSTVRLVAGDLGVAAGILLGEPVPSCANELTLTVHPGVYGVAGHPHPRIAPDIPRGPIRVSMPIYPHAVRVTKTVGTLTPQYPANPYLQMAVAEYRVPADLMATMRWYRSAFTGCRWRVSGSTMTNSDVLAQGTVFTAKNNPNLDVDVSFGAAPSGETYVAYAVEDITYPERPARSYLHGPFSQVRIAIRHNPSPTNPADSYTVHAVIADRQLIARLVAAIDSVDGYHTVSATCLGGFISVGPAWLTFVRSNGVKVHAYEVGPGGCLGLAVNGVRWLIDPGPVWKLITHDICVSRGRG